MTEQAPYLSIITPVRNASRFIEKCMRNVAEQGCDSYEHIFIESGSTDDTADTIRTLMNVYPHVRLIHCDRPGQSAALNDGMKAARGTVLGNVNVDDWYEPAVLPRIRGIFADLPVPSLVAGNCAIWNKEMNLLRINRPRRMNMYDWLVGPEVHEFPTNPSAYFFHRALLDHMDGFVEEEHYQMDMEFLLRAGLHAHMKYIDELWGNFFLHEGSKTYQDIRSGHPDETRRKIFDAFIASLPWRKRMRVYLNRFWWGAPMRAIRGRLFFGF